MRFHALCLLAGIIVVATTAISAPAIDSALPNVVLKDDDGGRVDGTPWQSSMLRDKVWTLFYVDPDKKDINGKLEDALKAQKFPAERYGSLAVINMDATWLPNAVIASSLKKKQEEFPSTIYVKDMKKVLVSQWKLTDDDYNVLVFDKEGKLKFFQSGTLSDSDIERVIAVIKASM
jgi:YtfJ family uncharacterized protein